MLAQYADIRVGGSSVDGVSRAGLNKIVGTYFAEGMRKPARNGNPGELVSLSAHRLARHFLRARWRNPDDAEDMKAMAPFFEDMSPHQVEQCISVLREFMEWRPGPAGRVKDALSHQGQRGSARRGKGDPSRPSCAKRCHEASALMDAIPVGDTTDSFTRQCPSPVFAPAGHYNWQPAPEMPRVLSSAPLAIAAYLTYPDLAQLTGASQCAHPHGQAPNMSAAQTSRSQDQATCFGAHAYGDAAAAPRGVGMVGDKGSRRLCAADMKKRMLPGSALPAHGRPHTGAWSAMKQERSEVGHAQEAVTGDPVAGRSGQGQPRLHRGPDFLDGTPAQRARIPSFTSPSVPAQRAQQVHAATSERRHVSGTGAHPVVAASSLPPAIEQPSIAGPGLACAASGSRGPGQLDRTTSSVTRASSAGDDGTKRLIPHGPSPTDAIDGCDMFDDNYSKITTFDDNYYAPWAQAWSQPCSWS